MARTEYKLFNNVDDNSLFGLPPGTQSQFSIGITRNNLNHPLFPIAGSRQSWNTEFNGGILGGDGDFTRHLAEGSWYVPIGQVGGTSPGSSPVQFTLGLHLKGGAVFGDVSNFPFDRFWMGGVQFGENLRGYDETSITPLGYYPERSREISDINRLGNAFVSTTAELAMRISDNISLSTFFDAGNVWADAREHRSDPPLPRSGFGCTIGDALWTHWSGLRLRLRQDRTRVAAPLQDGPRVLRLGLGGSAMLIGTSGRTCGEISNACDEGILAGPPGPGWRRLRWKPRPT